MQCKLCGCNNVSVTYQGLIRDGALGRYTEFPVTMYRCDRCDTIWHEKMINIEDYYETDCYRISLEGTSNEEEFYRLHDGEVLEKFLYTGTSIYRHKVVADIGCGGGAFLDFLKGVSKKVLAVEPSEIYRKAMQQRGFSTYAYMNDMLHDYRERIDVIVSFDVIEHVDDPNGFLRDIFKLLSSGGKAIIGTPTEAPIMRILLGAIYEKKLLFSTQHLWVFNEKNLRMLAEMAGFSSSKTTVKYYQRYGLGNLLGWLREKEAKSDIREEFITNTMNSIFKSECESQKKSDYIVLYLDK